MLTILKEDQIGVTLIFDGWINIRNEQLLETVIITSEGRSYVWKAMNISSERETHVKVIEKINMMLTELDIQAIKVIAIVTDSAGAYATA
ncbi:4752_t:CDS:1, partial [Ambispora gerdemannii]